MTTAIIVAAGVGERLGDPVGIPKALRALNGRAMYLHALRTFDAHPRIERSVLVYPAIWEAQILEDLQGQVAGPVELVAGGATRQASVLAGLGAAAGSEFVMVHDAARPFVTPYVIDRVLDAMERCDAVICAIPVTDTLKLVSSGVVAATPARADLVQVQTPQCFRTELLRRAHQRALHDGVEATDDASLVERLGETVAVVAGDERNIKITTPTDLAVAEELARAQVTR